MEVKLVNDATALLSLRDSDFDANSAFGEVIDNSIQAEAREIKINMDYEVRPRQGRRVPYALVEEIAFGDDGYGMDKETLHRCMQLGYSTRFNDRSGIGRFGVGMTLAAINQCKHVEIYSKQNGSHWLWTYFDLDKITANPPTMAIIPPPTERRIPEQYKSLVKEGQGTLVVWSKYDRQPVSALDMIEEMKIWVGRTYRKFIWDGLSIILNGERVLAIDPLYATTKMTKFPNDPPAYEYEPIKISWKVPPIDKPQNAPDDSVITIRMSLIDKKFRPYKGSGGSTEVTERYIDRNEGVSILRNNREVFYDPIPHWPGVKFVDIDRWWGCEISFDAVLDRAFVVKNIKRGAVPNKELKQLIYEKTKPTRDTALERVREVWRQYEEIKQKEHLEKDGEFRTGHEEAQDIAAKTPTDRSEIDKHIIDTKKEIKKFVDEVARNASEQNKQELQQLFEGQPFTIIDASWRGADFFETNHLGGKDVIKYNKRHEFIEVLYEIIENIQMDDSGFKHSKKLKSLIDLLIISYSKAEARFERDSTWSAEKLIETLRLNWGQYLKNYIATWRKEQQ